MTLASVVVALLAIVVPLAVRRGDRYRAREEKLRTENQALRDANVELKIQLVRLQGTATVVNRTFSALHDNEEPV
ncbi:MAG TPA: hypothetical protein VJT49_14865 [Amycolatopsis sp.]|uniref:hypothetical protein n=1 Tax=Amycolatopsis sp. TaxID=37632 RepID=UPI002B465252|nr:hypothetical protein [Amycolatopsis sp.]HKS46360.1 hypothetical protein [Amycolatopsis sp.]